MEKDRYRNMKHKKNNRKRPGKEDKKEKEQKK